MKHLIIGMSDSEVDLLRSVLAADTGPSGNNARDLLIRIDNCIELYSPVVDDSPTAKFQNPSLATSE